MASERLIACGMYAFNESLRRAWREFFERLFPLLDTSGGEYRLVFDSSRETLLDGRLFIGHTCGYPLMLRFGERLTPFCAPVFDADGCDGALYSSRFVVAANSTCENLSDCRDTVVAVNTPDSNSGMNVLRYALAADGARGRFFRRVLQTGSHLHSLEAVAGGRAQLAAIDSVTYRLVEDRDPGLLRAVRTIGFSTRSCGLPFVMPAAAAATPAPEVRVAAFNEALSALPDAAAAALHLQGFEAVTRRDYRAIVELEDSAVAAGYPELK